MLETFGRSPARIILRTRFVTQSAHSFHPPLPRFNFSKLYYFLFNLASPQFTSRRILSLLLPPFLHTPLSYPITQHLCLILPPNFDPSSHQIRVSTYTFSPVLESIGLTSPRTRPLRLSIAKFSCFLDPTQQAPSITLHQKWTLPPARSMFTSLKLPSRLSDLTVSFFLLRFQDCLAFFGACHARFASSSPSPLPNSARTVVRYACTSFE